MNHSFVLKDLQTTYKIAQDFAEEIRKLENQTIVLLLYGGLGAGKTTFVSAFGKALGIKERITSPTFIGLNEYYTGDIALFHMDLYQVAFSYENFCELLSKDLKKIFAIEWAENLDESLVKMISSNEDIIIYKVSFRRTDDSNSS